MGHYDSQYEAAYEDSIKKDKEFALREIEGWIKGNKKDLNKLKDLEYILNHFEDFQGLINLMGKR